MKKVTCIPANSSITILDESFPWIFSISHETQIATGIITISAMGLESQSPPAKRKTSSQRKLANVAGAKGK